MKNLALETFSLDNFEGPLEFLLHLIQKNEIEIYDIAIHHLTEQYLLKIAELLHPNIDSGAEFIHSAAALCYVKSKTLLPKYEQNEVSEEDLSDSRLEIIHQLIDYCRFKQAAKELAQLETKQSQFYLRGNDQVPDIKKNLGIEHLSLTDLADLFQQVLAKAVKQKGSIYEDIWKVSDKITFIKDLLKLDQKIEFEVLFSGEKSRDELIVTFLAVLELIKMGELKVIREVETNKVMIV